MTGITLLDGSIGQELVRRTGDRATPLWSTRVMIDHPGMVGEIHGDYFAAGATVATTNTYAVLRDRLVRVDLADAVGPLTETALAQAKAARDAHGSGRIAGSIGPLMASYRPDLFPPLRDAVAQYAEPVRLLSDHVDLLLFETVASLAHAEAALAAAAAHAPDKPVWIAVSVSDTDGTVLRSGEPLAGLAPLIERNAPEAVLINCSPPEVIADGLEVLGTFGRPFGAYANGFTKIADGFLEDFPTVDALEQRHDLGPQDYADIAMGWLDRGATILGGCCEIGPAHIAELHRRLIAAGHDIV